MVLNQLDFKTVNVAIPRFFSLMSNSLFNFQSISPH